jgi:hypothetical protein
MKEKYKRNILLKTHKTKQNKEKKRIKKERKENLNNNALFQLRLFQRGKTLRKRVFFIIFLNKFDINYNKKHNYYWKKTTIKRAYMYISILDSGHLLDIAMQ